MLDAMERYVNPNHPGFPLFKNFEKFSAQKLNQAVKKNQPAPSHKFFITCDDVYQHATALEAEMENYFIYLKAQLFAFASSELIDRKSQGNIQFFDDLLMLVKQALAAAKGNPLAEAIRQRYKAALVDEFQDTDSVQYEIFSKLLGIQNRQFTVFAEQTSFPI
jgi:exodeoxyribonuclease V beta subunit